MRVSSNHRLRDWKYVQLANRSRIKCRFADMADMRFANISGNAPESLPAKRSPGGRATALIFGLQFANCLNFLQHEIAERGDATRCAQLFGEGQKDGHLV